MPAENGVAANGPISFSALSKEIVDTSGSESAEEKPSAKKLSVFQKKQVSAD
jgi:hypothetical protein